VGRPDAARSPLPVARRVAEGRVDAASCADSHQSSL
jgi:hypothetical protein